MNEIVAIKEIENEELWFVIPKKLFSEGNDPFELYVYRNYLSKKRETIETAYFNSLAEAKEHCRLKYGIQDSDWKTEIRLGYEFRFDYKVTSSGVPQPVVLGFEDAEILIRKGKVFVGARQKIQPSINICGNREGLRQLAAMLLLAADSAQYDDSFHIHLEDRDSVDTDIITTIRAPGYLSILKEGSFREGSIRL